MLSALNDNSIKYPVINLIEASAGFNWSGLAIRLVWNNQYITHEKATESETHIAVHIPASLELIT